MNIQDIKKQVEEVAEKAQQAFWDEVAKNFPEISTGDMPIQAVFQFNKECEEAVGIWVKSNHPSYPKE
ncbi:MULTISPECIES: hypothetical protein [Burkholderiaceae]|jgi:hypothetical protein|uniref:Uncharacterized protein n=2 Tax=Burkholderiaceae TaxID=119060 RepID=A0A6J5JHE9_9BURK|nr:MULTISPECIES: hypothetical protein [Burkholderiaceae]ANJ73101.1 hypothetical protein A9Y76_11735 [Ralstonia insidiosa]KAB0601834.1 hypothetical protein F7R19_15145 [Cupriavidus pauculus]MBR8498387.1 hypothetical protein [Burkholderia cenocepacia]MCO8393900.1 hypothetical protein [Burkholderia cenocepacia]MCO8402256.1 hypothetical protein [Burkholderia cenocepacia]